METAMYADHGDKRTYGYVRFVRFIPRLLMAPGDFFESPDSTGGYGSSLVFLFSMSLVYAILAILFVAESRLIFGLVFFLNAFVTPFILASILYLLSLLSHRGVYTFSGIFSITAYASVTLLFSWIPGIAMITGLWKFCLVGVGMARQGGIGGLKAALHVFAAATIMLLFIQLFKPLMIQ